MGFRSTLTKAFRIRGAVDYDDSTPPADGEVVTWDAAAGKYVPAAGGGGGLPANWSPKAGDRDTMESAGTGDPADPTFATYYFTLTGLDQFTYAGYIEIDDNGYVKIEADNEDCGRAALASGEMGSDTHMSIVRFDGSAWPGGWGTKRHGLMIGADGQAYLGLARTAVDGPGAGNPFGDASVFIRDNGAGKDQLCVHFKTGAVQVIATEP